MFLTYPNQLMRSYEILEIRNLNQQKGKTIATIDIQAIEILQRRPKEQAPCHENWRNYDNGFAIVIFIDMWCTDLFTVQ